MSTCPNVLRIIRHPILTNSHCPQLVRTFISYSPQRVVIVSTGKLCKAAVDPWNVDIVKAEEVCWICNIQQSLIFKLEKQLVIHMQTSTVQIPPKSLYPLVVYRFSRNKRVSAWSPQRVIQHESSNVNVLDSTISSYSTTCEIVIILRKLIVRS